MLDFLIGVGTLITQGKLERLIGGDPEKHRQVMQEARAKAAAAKDAKKAGTETPT